jgi:hypothetical protein
VADFASAFVQRLLADSGVAAAVGDRIFWLNVPQNTAFPYVRLQVISDPRTGHLQGADDARISLVQADCMASSYGAQRAASDEIIRAASLPATVAGVRFGRTLASGPTDEGEDTARGFVFRGRIELMVEHS